MAIPQSVIEERERADRLIAEAYSNPDEQSAAESPDETNDEQTGKETTPTPSDPAAGTEVQPDSAGVEHNWKDRFSGLQRSRDALASDLKQERLASAEREKQLLERIEKLEQANAAPQVPSAPDRSFLSEEDLALFGEDNLRVVEKVAERIAFQRMSEMTQQQQHERERSEATLRAKRAATEKKNDFLTRLRGVVSNFESIDNDPKFTAWMKEVDPITGYERSELLSRAYKINDVGRAASFYSEYVAQGARDPREALIQPKPAGNPPAEPTSNKGRIWRESEISNFYQQKTLGKFRADPEKARALERDIFAAQTEGRIRPG